MQKLEAAALWRPPRRRPWECANDTDIRLTRTLYGSALKIRDPGAADRQDARSRLVVTHVVTGTDSGT